MRVMTEKNAFNGILLTPLEFLLDTLSLEQRTLSDFVETAMANGQVTR